jgi:hypothetical protein
MPIGVAWPKRGMQQLLVGIGGHRCRAAAQFDGATRCRS